MPDNPTSAASLAAEFTDVLASELATAPDAEYVFAKMAYASAVKEEIRIHDPEAFDIIAAQLRMAADPKSGILANTDAAMAGGGEGSLILSVLGGMGGVLPDLIMMVAEGAGPGDNIKVNRPKYLDDVVNDGGAGRILSTNSLLFGSSQPIQMDQIEVRVLETSGPGDASGNTVPISLPLFLQARAKHDMLENAKLQIRRSRWRFVHFLVQQYLLKGTNLLIPNGAATDAAITGSNFLDYETCTRVERELKKRFIPGVGGAPVYPFFVSSDGVQQLQNDPAYQRLATFEPMWNQLLPGYLKSVGKLLLCECETFKPITGIGVGGTYSALPAVAFGPGAVAWALGKDAELKRDNNDDGGRFCRVAWEAIEGFAMTNNDFIEVVHHSTSP